MPKRGGARPGSGRPKGAVPMAPQSERAGLAEQARAYTNVALKTLAHICVNGTTESARVSASTSLLDRGYGKPYQSIGGVGSGGEGEGPLVVEIVKKTYGD